MRDIFQSIEIWTYGSGTFEFDAFEINALSIEDISGTCKLFEEPDKTHVLISHFNCDHLLFNFTRKQYRSRKSDIDILLDEQNITDIVIHFDEDSSLIYHLPYMHHTDAHSIECANTNQSSKITNEIIQIKIERAS